MRKVYDFSKSVKGKYVGKTKQPKRKRLVRCPHCPAMLNPKYALAHVIDTHSDDLD